MVALKVQSLDDIMMAYFASLGYQDKEIKKIIPFIHLNYEKKLDPEKVIASLDDVLYGIVKKYLPATKQNKQQRLSYFKTVFLLNEGAKLCGGSLFEKGEIPETLQAKLKENFVQAAPEIKFSKMEPQKIENLEFFNFFAKIFNLFHKD